MSANRRIAWLSVGIIVAALSPIILLPVVMLMFLGLGLDLSPLPELIGLLCGPVGVTIVVLIYWRVETKAVGRTCPDCDYNLKGTLQAGGHICPECGRQLPKWYR